MEKKSIVIVDDNASFKESLHMELKKCSTFEVLGTYEDGEDFLLNGPKKIDLLVVDCIMPKVDGIEVLKQCKAYGVQYQQVMCTSSITNETLIAEMQERKVDYFMLKPIHPKQFVEKCMQLVSKSSKSIINGPMIPFDVDVESEEKIYKMIEKHLKNKSYIIVTHRENLKKLCDRHFIFENHEMKEVE